MNDAVWKRDEADSPCVRVCVIHPQTRLCAGCLRTPDEIAAWSRMTPQARRAVLAELPARAPMLAPARLSQAASRRAQ
jgi:uncharacterized protein